MPGLFIEAEFHAVWKSPEGKLIDLNPRPLKTENILFLPDPNIIYDGNQKNNFRLALTNNPTVSKFLKLHDKIFEFMNRGERKGQYGEVKLNHKDAFEYSLMVEEMAVIQMHMKNVFKPLGIYDPCICGSGKKAKWCHKLKYLELFDYEKP
ncbi:SEC-C domain-containing protein [Acinetobacter sp. UGAL515B_02]|nr:SEC-C domain-containing protein [Acinetobacter sp. UGAL515B_02]WON81462.1 SEC-C domain-containing protein [Acinetobacter sp. UGAL515B_02]